MIGSIQSLFRLPPLENKDVAKRDLGIGLPQLEQPTHQSVAYNQKKFTAFSPKSKLSIAFGKLLARLGAFPKFQIERSRSSNSRLPPILKDPFSEDAEGASSSEKVPAKASNTIADPFLDFDEEDEGPDFLSPFTSRDVRSLRESLWSKTAFSLKGMSNRVSKAALDALPNVSYFPSSAFSSNVFDEQFFNEISLIKKDQRDLVWQATGIWRRHQQLQAALELQNEMDKRTDAILKMGDGASKVFSAKASPYFNSLLFLGIGSLIKEIGSNCGFQLLPKAESALVL